ncbi:hypothetical protein [Salimicrobium flavidum]|uniref:hypothetical protein n=1 Tax=Salimicrobium flavidum TaxID=570947 RepID=UPI0009707A51|nr:hypothetical protein [Salimicrobium flavidum]
MKTAYLINTVISGALALLIATFFAQGTIAENYSDKTWVAPEFLWVLPIWGIGFLIGLFVYRSRAPGIFLFFSILVTWASIPIGISIGFELAG